MVCLEYAVLLKYGCTVRKVILPFQNRPQLLRRFDLLINLFHLVCSYPKASALFKRYHLLFFLLLKLKHEKDSPSHFNCRLLCHNLPKARHHLLVKLRFALIRIQAVLLLLHIIELRIAQAKNTGIG